MAKFIPPNMGWIPDLPDARDYTARQPEIRRLLERLSPPESCELPDEVDLRGDEEGQYFPPAENQAALACSASFAVLGLLTYFERRISGRVFDASPLFLYRITRNMLGKGRSLGDSGADLRTSLKALQTIGVPPEEYWPYETSLFDTEPSSFVYGLAKPQTELRYFRLDTGNTDVRNLDSYNTDGRDPDNTGGGIWNTLRSFLAAGFPVAFGFSVPSSLSSDAEIPYRGELDAVRGGQAAVAVGYKLDYFGRRRHALRIRSSWGTKWGDQGFGWLPTAYLSAHLARDFWTVLSERWVDTKELTRPQLSAADDAAE